MRVIVLAVALTSLVLAGCSPAPTDQSMEQAPEESGAAADTGSVTAQEAANCMAYTTRLRQAVLAGQAQGDAAALLTATTAWQKAVEDKPEAQELYQAAMASFLTMNEGELKTAADDCVARAPR